MDTQTILDSVCATVHVHGKRYENYNIYLEFSFPAFSCLAFSVAPVHEGQHAVEVAIGM